MPLRQFCCSICGRCAPRKYLRHGQFANRMRWLRRHYKRYHPAKFRKSIKKAVHTRKRRYG